MPIEDTPNFLNDNEQPEKPRWIDEVVLEFRNGNPNHLTYDQLQEKKMLAMTQTAVKAASSGYISGHVENYAFVNTPEPITPQPAAVEVPHFSQLSELDLSKRIEEFRTVLLQEREPQLFVPEPINLEGKNRQDFDLAA